MDSLQVGNWACIELVVSDDHEVAHTAIRLIILINHYEIFTFYFHVKVARE